MPIQSEKSEMLTVYDEDLNPIGERTRKEVHENELLHQTIRMWAVAGGQIWFQQRSQDKALFPGRFDLAATGHMDPGEKPVESALRETREEIGLELGEGDLCQAGRIPFPFRRPDGKLDNEVANVYLYMPEKVPGFQISDEVAGLGSMRVRDYEKLLRTGEPVTMNLYECRPDGGRPVRTGTRTCGPDDFCCLNEQEWKLVQKEMSGREPSMESVRKGRDVSDLPGFGPSQDTRSDELCRF